MRKKCGLKREKGKGHSDNLSAEGQIINKSWGKRVWGCGLDSCDWGIGGMLLLTRQRTPMFHETGGIPGLAEINISFSKSTLLHKI
jgi:hypothetical protein